MRTTLTTCATLAGLALLAPLARAQTTERVSVRSGGAQANSDCPDAFVTADGRYVGFACIATNLVVGDTNGWEDVFVRDRVGGTTERVNLSSTGSQPVGKHSGLASISADGRCVSFIAAASDLSRAVAGNRVRPRDRALAMTTLPSTRRMD